MSSVPVLTAARIARATKALYIHRILFRFALAAGNTFAWIFIFRAFYAANASIPHAVAGVGILYAIAQLIPLFLTPLAGLWLRSGVKRILFYGIAAAAVAYVLHSFMFLSRDVSDVTYWAISMFVIFNGIQRALYWIPYRTAIADVHATRSPFVFARELAIALVPFFAGLVIGENAAGAPWVLVAAGACALFSTIPLLFMPTMHERYSWSYHETWMRLISRTYERRLLQCVLDGMQGAALFLVWPLGVFLLLGWSYTVLGLVMSTTLVAALVFRRGIQAILRLLRVDSSVHVSAAVAFSSWVMRMAVASPLYIVAVDAYYHASASPKKFNIDPFSFDQTADSAHFVDEETALKEMGLAAGRILMAIVLTTLALLFTEPVAFAACLIMAACSAVASVYLSVRKPGVVY